MSPTAAIGGILRNVGSNTCLGSGCFFVAEADESDGTFLNYRPEYSIITNIDREHLDYYGTFERQVEAFAAFIANTKPQGCVFFCADDPVLSAAGAAFGGRKISFGIGSRADITARAVELRGLTSAFDCYRKDTRVGRFVLSLGGMHNVSNALSVIALGVELGIPVQCICEALSTYQGARRRLEVKWSGQGITIIDDYAHHPTEIKATIAALLGLSAKRLVVVFQPHRYSRTEMLFEEFAQSFSGVDHLVVTDIYAASEQPREGVSALKLADRIRHYLPDADVVFKPKQELTEYLASSLCEGDVCVTMGAGDIVAVGEEVSRRL
jgi:UDP-N-acetylmuramate--alanine ligase